MTRLSLSVVESFNGVVLYRGKSLLNGEPIVVIATNLRRGSKNSKTGDFIQVYILSDENVRPTDTVKVGLDESVCGDCIHRPKFWGTCYVNLGQGPQQVYYAYRRGNYPAVTDAMLQEFFPGRVIRLGAYGDPAAVPVAVWDKVCTFVKGWTGYTHQWRTCDQRLKHYCMASVETLSGQRFARRKGWKTFRIRTETEPLGEHEFICPAAGEAGKRLTCEDCLACCGGEWNGRTVTPVIISHGQHYKAPRFARMKELVAGKRKYRQVA